jgi:thiamine monophosphate synthase
VGTDGKVVLNYFPGNAGDVRRLEAGIDALAVIAGVFEADDIRAAARAFASLYSRYA